MYFKHPLLFKALIDQERIMNIELEEVVVMNVSDDTLELGATNSNRGTYLSNGIPCYTNYNF